MSQLKWERFFNHVSFKFHSTLWTPQDAKAHGQINGPVPGHAVHSLALTFVMLLQAHGFRALSLAKRANFVPSGNENLHFGEIPAPVRRHMRVWD